MKETDLYPPIQIYLEAQGYQVKGEVKHCDLVAKRGEEPLLIVELKTRLNLELILQAADRLSLSQSVYIAFPSSAPLWRRQWRRVRGLCQRLGLGVITLEGAALKVKVRLDPVPYRPRGSQVRQHRLLSEFERRVGDHNLGGMMGEPIMTAYRQDALRCVAALSAETLSLAEIRQNAQVVRAGGMLQKDHYGWFERERRGHYKLTPNGVAALEHYADVIADLLRHRADNGVGK